MNKIRQALYTLNNFTDEQIQKTEKDLKNRLTTFRKLYEIDENLKPEQAKNAILHKYFESLNDPQEDRFAINAQKFSDCAPKFLQIFKIPLSHYWQGNVMGFDVLTFDAQVIKSGPNVMADTIKSNYGDEGLNLIKELLAV